MNIIDVVCIILALLFLVIGFKKGLAKVLLRLFAGLIAAFSSRAAATSLSGIIYSNFVHSAVASKLNEIFPAGSVEGSVISSAKEAIPASAYKIAVFFELFTDQIVDPEKMHTVEQIETAYVQPILTKVIVIITSVLLFLLLSFILILIANAINKHFFENRQGAISKMNKILGGLLGFVRGIVPIAAGCMILNLIASLSGESAFASIVQSSAVCSYIAGIF